MHSRFLFLTATAMATLACPITHAHASMTGSAIENPQISAVTLVKNQTNEDKSLAFVKDMTKEGIEFLSSTELSETQREEKFRAFLKENFDMKTIGKFVLGRYWRVSTTAQKKEYLNLFEEMVVTMYTRRFGEYNGEELRVKSVRKENETDSIVLSEIIAKRGPDITVEWRVRHKKNGQAKVIDILVKGVSMALTQRSDFASVIQRGGGKVDVLLAHLREK